MRFLDIAAEHEVVAEDAHGLTQRLADHRLAGARDHALEHGDRGPPRTSPPRRTMRPVSIRPNVEAFTNRLSEWPKWRSHWPLADLSAISASAVSRRECAAALRRGTSAMMPSSDVRPYSCMKASMPPCLWRLARAEPTKLLASSAIRRRSSAVIDGPLDQPADEPRLVAQMERRQSRRAAARRERGRRPVPTRICVFPSPPSHSPAPLCRRISTPGHHGEA